MKELFQNLMNLDKPILTKELAPKLAPFARIIYIIVLIFLAITTLGTLGLLWKPDLPAFILALLGICAEFAIIRMFCEYLTASHEK